MFGNYVKRNKTITKRQMTHHLYKILVTIIETKGGKTKLERERGTIIQGVQGWSFGR